MITCVICGSIFLVMQSFSLQGQFRAISAIEATIVRGDEYATYTLTSATGHLFILSGSLFVP
jgi:hypothetical protein